MDNQTSSQHTSIYGLASGLAFFCGALLALSFGLRIFSDFALSPLVNESLNWLQGFSNADNGLALLRRYGGYALGNIELITFSFLLISPLRMPISEVSPKHWPGSSIRSSSVVSLKLLRIFT